MREYLKGLPTVIEADKGKRGKEESKVNKSCDTCKWNKTDKCRPSTCAMIGFDGHGLWEMIESDEAIEKVLEVIKTEIKANILDEPVENGTNAEMCCYNGGLLKTIEIIDRYISGKE